jgi:transcriptional regulator with XRE-family HTH domain
MPASLGVTIRSRRLELGLTQEQLAERISTEAEYVRQSEISRIENGAVGLPRRARLERIAQALDLSLGELLARSGWSDADQHLTPRPLEHRHVLPDQNTVAAGIDAEPRDPSPRQQPAQHGSWATFVTMPPGNGNGRHQLADTIGLDRADDELQSMRKHREARKALIDAMDRLGTEKERLLRNRRAMQELQSRFDRTAVRDTA